MKQDPIGRVTQILREVQTLVWPHSNLVTSRVDPKAPALLDGDGFDLLRFISRPMCPVCGLPLYFEPNVEDMCAECMVGEYAYDAVRSALEYDDYSKAMIFGLKRAGHRHGLKLMAQWMVLAGADMIEQGDAFVPVPLHFTRQARRGYNQALWLAAALSRQTRRPVMKDVLIRTKSTPPQGIMNNTARRKNVSGVFAVSNPDKIRNKRLVIIDDVFTTGATVDACAAVLKQAGARHVSILTLARVVKRESETK